MGDSRINIGKLIDKYPLAIFFISTAFLTWPLFALWTRSVSPGHGSGNTANIIAIAIGLVPAAVGALLTCVIEGRDGISRLMSGSLKWKARIRWYFAAAMMPIAISAMALALLMSLILVVNASVNTGMFSSLPRWNMPGPLKLIIVLINEMGIALGVFGYALPRLHKKYSPVVSATILGIFLSLISYHGSSLVSRIVGSIPNGGLSILEQTDYINSYMMPRIVVLIPLAFILVWLYGRTRGSVPLVAVCMFFFEACALVESNLIYEQNLRLVYGTDFVVFMQLKVLIYFVVMFIVLIVSRNYFKERGQAAEKLSA